MASALGSAGRAVLVAPPGTGKSTVLPALLLDAPWRRGRMLLVEPRRLAARVVARRLARAVGTALGDRVGYTIRHDRKRSSSTELEVVTEGVLLRRLQRDPSLTGVSLVIIDEFHERSLDADLALTFLGDVRTALREDLRVLVMSATPDLDAAVRALDGGDTPVPVISVEGRVHPVEVRYRPLDLRHPLTDEVADAVLESLRLSLPAAEARDTLVFLPGAPEIHRVARRLAGRVPDGTVVHPLTGRTSPEAQDEAITPDPAGRRRIILATAVAQTSITIEGVGLVIDAGRARRRLVDPVTGIGHLGTSWVSRAAAEQRRGRAGRVGPGLCVRLWSETDHRHLPDHDPPEIRTGDLSGLALTLAAWGAPDGADLPWPEPPDPVRLQAARAMLVEIGCIDGRGRPTELGRRALELGVEPRVAVVALTAPDPTLGAALATALEMESGEVDLSARVTALLSERRGRSNGGDPTFRELSRRLGAGPGTGAPDDRAVARCLLAGFPERLARRRADGTHLLVSGRTVEAPQPLGSAEWLVAVDLNGNRLHAGAVLDPRDVPESRVTTERIVGWDRRRREATAVEQDRIGAVVLRERPLPDPPAEAWLEGLAAEGLRGGLLEWTPEVETLLGRVRAGARYTPDLGDWPDWSEDGLERVVPDLLLPHLAGCRRRADLRRIDVREVLRRSLPWTVAGQLDRLTPERLELPSGRRVAIDWTTDPPVVAARLQDFFGLHETPRVLDGRVPVSVHLLSPAGRTAAITSDLAAFWTGGYRAVRADLRGRYPKHAWPEDPSAHR